MLLLHTSVHGLRYLQRHNNVALDQEIARKLSLHTSCNTHMQSSSCVTHVLSMTADYRHWYDRNSTMQTKRKLLGLTPELVLPGL